MKSAFLFLSVVACNQVIYDNLYKTILQDAIKSELTQKDINQKNDTIENLRALCQGQLSTYETGVNK